jgi:hypothetical protein
LSADVPEGKGKLVLKLKLVGNKLEGELAAQPNGDAEAFTGTMSVSKVE